MMKCPHVDLPTPLPNLLDPSHLSQGPFLNILSNIVSWLSFCTICLLVMIPAEKPSSAGMLQKISMVSQQCQFVLSSVLQNIALHLIISPGREKKREIWVGG